MAHDAMEGLVEVLIEDGEEIPESDPPYAAPRFDHLARTLREDGEMPVFEQLSLDIAVAARPVCLA